ncbi:MAG TPA: iron-containing alcohol dehydrogenase, partial [Bryobacteraceae bacterium]|nr:iron-containing alcohol dehydrogenase [Bryobacteraceae bacterium]
EVSRYFGIGLLPARRARLHCVPTTSGTGSEVSPNAILLSENSSKQGVISPHLVPDAAYIDPLLAATMPPHVTAATGLDALAHCMEAYTNRFAHPAVDAYALQGIRLVAAHLPRAVAHGDDLEAREAVALGSLFGGLCLGPVNTAAIHALAYPLGGEFHVPHGLSIAVLMAPVMKYNFVASADRYAQVAVALGAPDTGDLSVTARLGVEKVRELLRSCRVDPRLSALGVPESAIPGMAAAAMTVARLLKNNPREMNADAAEMIYRSIYN